MSQVSHLSALLSDLETLIEKKLWYKCQGNEEGNVDSCHQRQIDIEVSKDCLRTSAVNALEIALPQVELHQTKLAVEAAEVRLRQVEVESKQKLDQLQELRSKVRGKGDLYEMQNA